MAPFLLDLSDALLTTVLLRAPLATHGALARACRRLRRVVASRAFARRRVETGHHLTLLPPNPARPPTTS